MNIYQNSKLIKLVNISKNLEPIEDEYLSKFNIYCLIKSGKKKKLKLY